MSGNGKELYSEIKKSTKIIYAFFSFFLLI